jgi:hypothetical protein
VRLTHPGILGTLPREHIGVTHTPY